MRKVFSTTDGFWGVSLIELMITIIIISILAAVTYPSYLNAIKKSRRASAQTLLLDIAQAEQQYLLDNRTFANSLLLLNIPIPQNLTPYYNITIAKSDGPPPNFTVTATPIETSAQSGDVILSMDNLGEKLPPTVW